nr:sugar ABC transporter substrate-binding protein [Francisella philomiragia]
MKKIFITFLLFCLGGLAFANSVMPGLTEFDQIAEKGAGLPETKNNPPPSMASGLASVTAMNQGNGIEDKAGSQFSNKVINDDFVPQLNKLQVFGA